MKLEVYLKEIFAKIVSITTKGIFKTLAAFC